MDAGSAVGWLERCCRFLWTAATREGVATIGVCGADRVWVSRGGASRRLVVLWLTEERRKQPSKVTCSRSKGLSASAGPRFGVGLNGTTAN